VQQLSLGIGVALGAFALEAAALVHRGRNLGAADFGPALLMVARSPPLELRPRCAEA
jgi:hypothetical protein